MLKNIVHNVEPNTASDDDTVQNSVNIASTMFLMESNSQETQTKQESKAELLCRLKLNAPSEEYRHDI